MCGIRNANYRQCIRLCTFASFAPAYRQVIEIKLCLFTEKADSLLDKIKLLVIYISIFYKIKVCRDSPDDFPCVFNPHFQKSNFSYQFKKIMSYFPKLDRFSSSIILIACGAMLVATVATPNNAVADSTSSSNYQNSCRNIRVDQTTLSARCRRVNGGSNRTSIQIRGIENRNGTLTYLSDATDSSNYQNSCRNIRVDETTLSARCRRVNGGSNTTSIRIRGIENRDGTLNYR